MRRLATLALVLSSSAFAGRTPDYRALDVHALLDSITGEQNAQFHIAQATWKSATDTPGIPVEHAFILGSLEGVATYNADGSIVTAGLTILPTTYLIRIPAAWNGDVIVLSPPGSRNHLHTFPFTGPLMQGGYATVMIYAALPASGALPTASGAPPPPGAGFPYDEFIGSHRTHDTGANVFSTVHMVKDLFGDAFARPFKTYYAGFSGGTLWGAGLIAGHRGNPIDGYILGTGGNGWRTETDEHMRAYRTARPSPTPGQWIIDVPLTGQVTIAGGIVNTLPLEGTVAFDTAVDTEIGIADPEYRALILAQPAGQRYAKLVAYDSTTRPDAVQRAWEDLVYNPDLQVPTIVVQGTADLIQYVRNSLVFTRRVIDAGRKDRLRLYLIKGQGHGPTPPFPQQGILDSIEALRQWVEAPGHPQPGPIDFAQPGAPPKIVPNNWNLNLQDDPCAYFHSQFDPANPATDDCGL